MITDNEVEILESSGSARNPPTFTLRGDTRGGPPETYIWRRNGQEISDGGAYTISIRVNDVFRDDPNSMTATVNRESRYRSTLVVTGDLPGVYEYSVTNRATSTMVVDSFNIEGICIATCIHTCMCMETPGSRVEEKEPGLHYMCSS